MRCRTASTAERIQRPVKPRLQRSILVGPGQSVTGRVVSVARASFSRLRGRAPSCGIVPDLSSRIQFLNDPKVFTAQCRHFPRSRSPASVLPVLIALSRVERIQPPKGPRPGLFEEWAPHPSLSPALQVLARLRSEVGSHGLRVYSRSGIFLPVRQGPPRQSGRNGPIGRFGIGDWEWSKLNGSRWGSSA